MRAMALAMRLASSDVSFTVPKRPLVEVVPAMDGCDHDAVAVVHHERIRVSRSTVQGGGKRRVILK